MSDPWEKMPVPLDAPDRERIDNAILHLGRVLGGVAFLHRIIRPLDREWETLKEIESAAKRAATWLGVTLWREEEEEESQGMAERRERISDGPRDQDWVLQRLGEVPGELAGGKVQPVNVGVYRHPYDGCPIGVAIGAESADADPLLFLTPEAARDLFALLRQALRHFGVVEEKE